MTKVLTKSSFDTIEAGLLSTDLTTIEAVTNRSRNDLLSSLNMTNNFFVDQENKTKIDALAQSLTKKENDLRTILSNLTTERANLTAEDIPLRAEYDRIMALPPPPPPLSRQNEISLKATVERRNVIAARLIAIGPEILRITDIVGHINPARKTEYQTLSSLTNRFDFTRPLQDMKQNTYNLYVDMMIP